MPHPPSSDVIVVTSFPPAWDALAEITCESHAAYCQARGYDYDAERADLQDQRAFGLGRGPAIGIRGFHKFNRILHFLPMYRYVIWLDADLVVTNTDVDLVAHLDPEHAWGLPTLPRTGPGIIVGYDWNGFNTTVQIVRSSPLAQAYYWACNNTGRDLFLYHGWHEMEAMRYFSMKPPYDRLLGYESIKTLCAILPEEYEPSGVPRPIMQPYSWSEGDFSVHLSALSLERRIELARSFYEKYVVGAEVLGARRAHDG